MPKRKHTKKNPVVACADANERLRKSAAEKERVAAALLKRREKLMQEYEEEMRRRNLDTSSETPVPEAEDTEPKGVETTDGNGTI